jgi:hypothetical protein
MQNQPQRDAAADALCTVVMTVIMTVVHVRIFRFGESLVATSPHICLLAHLGEHRTGYCRAYCEQQRGSHESTRMVLHAHRLIALNRSPPHTPSISHVLTVLTNPSTHRIRGLEFGVLRCDDVAVARSSSASAWDPCRAFA